MSSAVAVPALMASATYRRGALLVAGAAVIWSSAGLLTRLAGTDGWTTLFWRAVFAALALGAYLAVRDGRRLPASVLRLGWVGAALAICFAASSICFVLALQTTSVAMVFAFQGASPLIAAAIAWAVLRERVSRATWIAMGAALVGVVITVSGRPDGVPHSIAGDLLSAGLGLGFAGTIVLARMRADVSVTAAVLGSLLLVAAASAPFATLLVAPRDFALLAAFGVGQMALALIMFAAGVRLIPSADAGLITLLECVLAPFWVWLALGENPGPRTLAGAAVVLGAVALAARADAVRRR